MFRHSRRINCAIEAIFSGGEPCASSNILKKISVRDYHSGHGASTLECIEA